jgi:long-chain acyl-CoA synthetase
VLSGGGAPMPPDLVGQVGQRASGAIPATGYGMTETCGAITATLGPLYQARPDSCGRLLPAYAARLIDDAGKPLPAGAVGELCVKGATVIKGYINRPEATAQTIVDGWLHTGDIARIDAQGYVYVLDRKKDMVLRGGENVYCAEVEAALYRHPAVAEACVFAVPDERLGEDVAAVVVLVPGHSATEDELRRTVAALIARHKVPRCIWIRNDPLPRSATGKFIRRELRVSYLNPSLPPTTQNPLA